MGGAVMAAITSRAEFIEYCLRRLGKPVIRINVAPEQLDDRVDEAIQAWQDKHYDATEKMWIGYALTQEDILNGYITLPSDIHVVDQIVPMSTIYKENGSDSLFSYRYQFLISNLSPFQPLDMINYYMTMTNLQDVNDLVNTTERFEFTKHKSKLIIYRGMEDSKVGEILTFHVFKKIDPDTTPDAWSDKWLKRYTTALIKQNWGSNMKKHGEIQLLGGVTVNGQQIFDEATAELEALDTELRDTYEEPVAPLLG